MKTVTSEGCYTYTLYYVSFIIATLFRIMRLQKKTQHWTNFYITVVLCFHIFWFVISDRKFLFLAVSFLSFDGSSSHNTTLTNEKQELLTRNYHWNCVCMCLFTFFHQKGFSWLNKTINIMPEFRSAMVCCGNITRSSSFVSMSKTIIERTFKLATAQKSAN